MKKILKHLFHMLPVDIRYLIIDKVKTSRQCAAQSRNMKFFDSINLQSNCDNFVCKICNNRSAINIEWKYDFDKSIVKHRCTNCGHITPSYEFNFLESNSYDFNPYFPEGELKLINKALKLTRNGKVLVLGGGGNFEYIKSKTPDNVFFTDLIVRKNEERYINASDLHKFNNSFSAIVSRAVVDILIIRLRILLD